MRRVILAVLILILPTTTAVIVYLVVSKSTPTNRNASGGVTTIAGSGAPGVEDGPALSARFSDPFGVAVDKRGNVVIADTSNNRIRKLSTDGTKVSTLAGSGIAGFKDGRAGEARFDGPIGVAVDKQGNVFVADSYNDSIRKISPEGVVTTVAGTGSPGYADGVGADATFDTPCGVAVDRDGNVFVADAGNHAVRKISTQGEVTTIAARGGDGPGEARLNRPVGVAVTHDGFLFVSDEGAGRILRIAPDGDCSAYAGSVAGFADSIGREAKMNGPACIAVDRQGVLYVADSQNYLIREIVPSLAPPPVKEHGVFVQPSDETPAANSEAIPKLDATVMEVSQTFPWPLRPQQSWHEIAGVIGEARGATGGVALDHIHSGLDIHGAAGEPALSVFDEKVASPIPNWDFDGAGEGIRVGLFSYIHVRIGRNGIGVIEAPEKFKARTGSHGETIGVRVRRGTRFRVGDAVGSLNRLNHVHLNLGPWNSQANPIFLPFVAMKDTVAPTIERIEIAPAGAHTPDVMATREAETFIEKRNGRLVVSGDVAIIVTAYDRVDGNGSNRKLGLFKAGYQLLHVDGSPVHGFEQPLISIVFNRLPAEDSSVTKAYATGSGISAYGTPTKFRYIVTNWVRDGEALDGLLRTSSLTPGDYIIRAVAEDFAGNRTSGPSTELLITVKN